MIYFIQAGEDGPFKIGYARTRRGARDRLCTHQTGNAATLILRSVVEGDREDEAALHDFFRKQRIRGEWFQPCPKLGVVRVHPNLGSLLINDAWLARRWTREFGIHHTQLPPAFRDYVMGLEIHGVRYSDLDLDEEAECAQYGRS